MKISSFIDYHEFLESRKFPKILIVCLSLSWEKWYNPFNLDLSVNFYETAYNGQLKDAFGKTLRDAGAQINGKYTCATVLRHASLEDREIAFDKRYQARQTCGFW